MGRGGDAGQVFDSGLGKEIALKEPPTELS